MTIHWKAVEQYFTVVLFVNPLTPRVKPWVIQIFLTFDSMEYLTVVLFVFQFWKNCGKFGLGVKGLKRLNFTFGGWTVLI